MRVVVITCPMKYRDYLLIVGRTARNVPLDMSLPMIMIKHIFVGHLFAASPPNPHETAWLGPNVQPHTLTLAVGEVIFTLRPSTHQR